MFSVIAAVGNAHLKCIGEACVRRYITDIDSALGVPPNGGFGFTCVDIYMYFSGNRLRVSDPRVF